MQEHFINTFSVRVSYKNEYYIGIKSFPAMNDT